MLTTPVTAIVPFLLKVEGSLWYHSVMLRYRHNTVAFPSKVTEVQMQSVHAKFCHIVDCLQSDTRMKLYRVIFLKNEKRRTSKCSSAGDHFKCISPSTSPDSPCSLQGIFPSKLNQITVGVHFVFSLSFPNQRQVKHYEVDAEIQKEGWNVLAESLRNRRW